jgi:hypothetical protein
MNFGRPPFNSMTKTVNPFGNDSSNSNPRPGFLTRLQNADLATRADNPRNPDEVAVAARNATHNDKEYVNCKTEGYKESKEKYETNIAETKKKCKDKYYPNKSAGKKHSKKNKSKRKNKKTQKRKYKKTQRKFKKY